MLGRHISVAFTCKLNVVNTKKTKLIKQTPNEKKPLQTTKHVIVKLHLLRNQFVSKTPSNTSTDPLKK